MMTHDQSTPTTEAPVDGTETIVSLSVGAPAPTVVPVESGYFLIEFYRGGCCSTHTAARYIEVIVGGLDADESPEEITKTVQTALRGIADTFDAPPMTTTDEE